MTGDVSVQDDINDLERYGCTGRTEKRQIQKLRSDPDLRTTPGGKGAVWFHTDPTLKKGYRIAINNDRLIRFGGK